MLNAEFIFLSLILIIITCYNLGELSHVRWCYIVNTYTCQPFGIPSIEYLCQILVFLQFLYLSEVFLSFLCVENCILTQKNKYTTEKGRTAWEFGVYTWNANVKSRTWRAFKKRWEIKGRYVYQSSNQEQSGQFDQHIQNWSKPFFVTKTIKIPSVAAKVFVGCSSTFSLSDTIGDARKFQTLEPLQCHSCLRILISNFLFVERRQCDFHFCSFSFISVGFNTSVCCNSIWLLNRTLGSLEILIFSYVDEECECDMRKEQGMNGEIDLWFCVDLGVKFRGLLVW